MTEPQINTSSAAPLNLVTWALRLGLGLLFLGASILQLIDDPQWVDEFNRFGQGSLPRYFVGVFQALAAVALMIPRTTLRAAACLLIIDVCALIAQVTVLYGNWIHTIVIGALLVTLIVLINRQNAHRQ